MIKATKKRGAQLVGCHSPPAAMSNCVAKKSANFDHSKLAVVKRGTIDSWVILSGHEFLDMPVVTRYSEKSSGRMVWMTASPCWSLRL